MINANRFGLITSLDNLKWRSDGVWIIGYDLEGEKHRMVTYAPEWLCRVLNERPCTMFDPFQLDLSFEVDPLQLDLPLGVIC